jgi:hypothetical protein
MDVAGINKAGNTEARSRNRCCCRKAINITYSWCVSIALVKQHAQYYAVVCDLSACTIFFDIIS